MFLEAGCRACSEPGGNSGSSWLFLLAEFSDVNHDLVDLLCRQLAFGSLDAGTVAW
jgi:hypothetical protein